MAHISKHLTDDQFWTLINKHGLTSIELPGFMSHHFEACADADDVNAVYNDLVAE